MGRYLLDSPESIREVSLLYIKFENSSGTELSWLYSFWQYSSELCMVDNRTYNRYLAVRNTIAQISGRSHEPSSRIGISNCIKRKKMMAAMQNIDQDPVSSWQEGRLEASLGLLCRTLSLSLRLPA
jgi:hypothetical protein